MALEIVVLRHPPHRGALEWMNPGHCERDQATLLMMWQVRTIDVGGGFHSKVIRTQCVVLPLLMCNVVARPGLAARAWLAVGL